MKYKSVVYTTIRAEIHHDTEFSSKSDLLASVMDGELLDYSNILGSSNLYNTIRVTEVEVVDDEVQDYNLAGDEDYADE